MAELITLRENSVDGSLVQADIGAGGTIWVSNEQSNIYQQDLYKAAEITVNYDNLSHTGTGGIPEFTAVIEGKTSSGQYFPVGYQFNPFRLEDDFSQFHTVVIDPTVFWADAGVANIIFTDRTIGMVHPQQVALPTTWRICVHAFVPDGSTLTNVDIDVHAELVNKEI